jgi:hypothetical protein
MATKKLHFETLQVHVGQEQADPATDAQYLFTRPPLMYFTTPPMQPHASACRTRETSTAV